MRCPGQDSRYWRPGAIFEAKCPKCGKEVEFFKDEATRVCKGCGHRFLNPGLDFGCASYCQYAEQCIGNLPPELISQKENLLKDRVAIEVKKYFGRDFKRIGHAMRVARYAEEIGREENGNLAVIIPAAYLHDIGIRDAEVVDPERVSNIHGEMGEPVAREILSRLKAREELIEEICAIIKDHHRPPPDNGKDFACVYDADILVNLEEGQKENPAPADELKEKIEKLLLTPGGRKTASKALGVESQGEG
ncbi:MAG: HD domain-containing protein [Desulfobacteraceae bacterium]|jgi:putative nucleotidyltransferase with HDIG domain|nr:MAG: HD domain-containing protein [Desulfobacteraceae bacterium]